MNADDVRAALRRACEKAGGQKAWASEHGVSGAYVSDVLNGGREPGQAILDALGIERIVTYRRIK